MNWAQTVRQTLAPIRARWSGLAARERMLLKSTALLGAGLLVWFALLRPSVSTLRAADEQNRALDAQLLQMHALQAQAQLLQQQAPLRYEEALKALELATERTLGNKAQVSSVGERVSVTLQAVPADALAQWLAQVRVNARATPVEARLVRAEAPQKGAPAGAAWNGVLTLTLPAR